MNSSNKILVGVGVGCSEVTGTKIQRQILKKLMMFLKKIEFKT